MISLCAQAVDFLCKSFLCSYCLSDVTLFVYAKLLRVFLIWVKTLWISHCEIPISCDAFYSTCLRNRTQRKGARAVRQCLVYTEPRGGRQQPLFAATFFAPSSALRLVLLVQHSSHQWARALCSALKWTVSSTQLDIHAFAFTTCKKGLGVLEAFTCPCKEDRKQFGRNVVNVRDILVISLGNLI